MGKPKSTQAQAKQSPTKQENGHSNGHSTTTTKATATSTTSSTTRQPTLIKINSDKIKYGKDEMISNYEYQLESCVVSEENGARTINVTPKSIKMQFKTKTHVPKTGLLLVGLGGNNGSTLVAGILANKHRLSWETRNGTQHANLYGSLTQSSTLKMGVDSKGKDVFVPFNEMLPMVNPIDLVIHGWDISGMNLGDAMKRAQVLEPTLRLQLDAEMREIKPMPSIYYPDFIAANQADRADNLIAGNDKWQHLEHLRKDIRDFKAKHSLEKVIIVWTANTERFAEIIPGINDTADNLLKAIKSSHPEVSPSTVFAVAAILEGVPFINGSPQNTNVPGCIELAEQHKCFLGGDDFKSGQTKMKSALVDFLINAGLKVTSIASYNHLGNNDGKNLSAPSQFRSKEISKSNVVDDLVASNHILYKEGEHPGHLVVIKYLPEVGDSKRALDEYTCEIFLGGKQTISMHNVCEDSLLATPLIIDLCVMAELFTRIEYKTESDKDWMGLHSVLSLLSYMLKAPLVKPGTPVINALAKQRAAIENVMRACLSLPPSNDMALEHKLWGQSIKGFY